MGGKHSKCCCCPNCTYRVELCCPCVGPALCVTFTPDDYADCDPESVELDWTDAINGYSGTLHGHDLYYYIERDPPAEGQERGPCMFKLRSNSLGYPEGYEYKWEIPCDPYDEEVPCTRCLSLQTDSAVPADEYDQCSGGTLSTECVRWVTPTNCDNCFCLCECLCAFVTKDGISYSGKLCWDDYTLNRWTGTLTGLDQYGAEVSLDMRVEVDRWGDVCDHETDYDCDPYDDSCAINAYIESEAGDIAANWQKMSEPCELRAVNYSWHIERDPETNADDIEISVRCATCNENCTPEIDVPCCPGLSLPASLSCTLKMRWMMEEEPPVYQDVEYDLTLTFDGTVQAWMGEVCGDPPEGSMELGSKCMAVAFGYDRGPGICYFAASPSPAGDWRSHPFDLGSLWPVYTSDLASWLTLDPEDWPTPLPTYNSGSPSVCIVHMVCDPFILFIGSPICEQPSSPVDVTVTL